ncbi:SNF1-related protein kinase catalytic subunit alpha like [Actinidia chinensis var. chinensis]|uniref:non-specific serine/threonine protein kinase n=1 Tax=Actinidia chinensis var. chinensis TaxID=1590841 RepID=A0A2R6PEU5_ACTCC|nr:SNF1-related protein kinase catalytic subunit alpha like [Actinidia chinensis var. chinensis]
MDGPGRSTGADMLLRNYRLGKTLGHGSFGKVKIAEHLLTGFKVAIKILNRRKMKSPEMEEKVRREIKICRLFVHPHIIRQYEVIETPADIYVVMEYVKSGELFDYIVEKGRLQEDEARSFFQQIISGVEYCHRNMVVHRDLKPENLLLDSRGNVKIADFGLSNVMRDGHFLKTSCGSPNYAAPEVVSGKLYAGPEIDVWSCGVILYALLCGTLPFDDENIPNLFKKIKGGIYTLPSHLSPGARDLIPRMLVVDPMKRITIPEIRNHYWFKTRLPRYLAVQPPDPAQLIKKIDEDVIQDVLNMGVDKNHLIESLRNRIQNDATVAYYLLFDNRSVVSSGYLGAEFQESMEYGSTGMHSDNALNLAIGQHLLQDSGLRPQLATERKWNLGLKSSAHPREIMTQVLLALKELNVRWKKIGHYNIKCRWFHGFQNPEAINHPHENHYITDESAIVHNDYRVQSIVKFEMQLYKTREENYLLDLQRVSGPQFVFLDLCAAFLMQLGALN